MRNFCMPMCGGCCSTNHLKKINDSTLLWPSNKSNESLVTKTFEVPTIRFMGLFHEEIKNKQIDLNAINKSGIKKISPGFEHCLFLFSNFFYFCY